MVLLQILPYARKAIIELYLQAGANVWFANFAKKNSHPAIEYILCTNALQPCVAHYSAD
jgi:hypothetical protein